MARLLSRFDLILILILISALVQTGQSCRISSERLKLYTKRFIRNLLDPDYLNAIYWPREPLDSNLLSRATGLNISLAETYLQLDNGGGNSIDSYDGMLRDYFVACSMDRDKTYALTFSLEVENPFKQVEVIHQTSSGFEPGNNEPKSKLKKFYVNLTDSTYSVQLSQRIKYDECLDVDHIQLSPTTGFTIDCPTCESDDRKLLDSFINKKMTQLSAELDSQLSEKLLLGLKLIFSQQRLDLELDSEAF